MESAITYTLAAVPLQTMITRSWYPVPDLFEEFGSFSKWSRGWSSRSLRPIGLERFSGAVAQLGERLICIQEVAGSIPTSSTRFASIGPVAQVARAHP